MSKAAWEGNCRGGTERGGGPLPTGWPGHLGCRQGRNRSGEGLEQRRHGQRRRSETPGRSLCWPHTASPSPGVSALDFQEMGSNLI